MTRAEARARAIDLFKQGYNCSQAVFGVFSQILGIDFDTAMRLSAPFGGGIGRSREVCGAVSGMCMALGLTQSTFDPADPDCKSKVYAETQALIGRFKEANGSIVCRDLLAGVKVTSGHQPEARSEEYYRKRPCAELVGDAAEYVYDVLKERGLV